MNAALMKILSRGKDAGRGLKEIMSRVPSAGKNVGAAGLGAGAGAAAGLGTAKAMEDDEILDTEKLMELIKQSPELVQELISKMG